MLFKGIGFIGSPISTVISRTILAIGGFIIASQYWDEQIIQDTCDKKTNMKNMKIITTAVASAIAVISMTVIIIKNCY